MDTQPHATSGIAPRAGHRRAWLRTCAALAPIAIVLGAGAAAQAQAQPAAPAATSVQEIVVTGSLITRPDFKAESPISTIGADVIKAAAAPSLDKVFSQMPQFAGAQGASEVGDAQGSIGFAGGQSYSDLRGLGPNRSLVLMDGRR
ncbi:MAG TPA: TonB-dependent receptor plug domain-containing protein, partial [Caulobacteraceae bacterium]